MATRKWSRSRVLILEGTDFELHPTNGYWYVIDSNNPGTALTDALPLKTAKKSAEYKAAHKQKLAEELNW